jgi:hypothetical protein
MSGKRTSALASQCLLCAAKNRRRHQFGNVGADAQWHLFGTMAQTPQAQKDVIEALPHRGLE